MKGTLQTCAPENIRSHRWGDEGMVKRAQTVSEDPHRRERKFQILLFHINILKISKTFCEVKINHLQKVISIQICIYIILTISDTFIPSRRNKYTDRNLKPSTIFCQVKINHLQKEISLYICT